MPCPLVSTELLPACAFAPPPPRASVWEPSLPSSPLLLLSAEPDEEEEEEEEDPSSELASLPVALPLLLLPLSSMDGGVAMLSAGPAGRVALPLPSGDGSVTVPTSPAVNCRTVTACCKLGVAAASAAST